MRLNPWQATRRLPALLAAAAVLAAITPAHAALVSERLAQGAGLTRAWYTQAPIDARTQRVVGSQLHDGSFYVLTTSGMLVAFDAETGATRWTRRCGDSTQPAYGPTIHHWTDVDGAGVETKLTRCGVVIGSTVRVLDADNGEVLFEHRLEGAPGAAPAITKTHAYVPHVGGRLVGYPFDTVSGLRLRVASPGRLLDTPTITQGRVIWSTTRGELWGAAADTGKPVYRYDTTAHIAGTPSIAGDAIYFANREGFVYSLDAERARPLWRNTIGVSVEKPVVALDDTVYVSAETPALHAFDIATGAERWRVEGLSDFVSASADHVYAVNPDGALGVLDRKTGEPVASWPEVGPMHPIANHESDRLYFVSATGMVQCFHDVKLAEPYFHNPEPEAPAEGAATEERPAVEKPAEDPFEDDPFGGADSTTKEEPAEDDPFGSDPFGGGEDPFGF